MGKDIDIKSLSDEELYDLSLEKKKDGYYTALANQAYNERKRRSGYIWFDGVPNRTNEYQIIVDYQGAYSDRY